MVIATSWWTRIFWKKWKYLLIVVAVIFVIVQIGNMSILGLVTEPPKPIYTKHHPHVAADKILSKWKTPQHSKLMKDPQGHEISLRGTRDKDLVKYFPNAKGKFTCFKTKQEIDYVRVNDDYCDCPEDGSDEPGTNACNRGVFYCEKVSTKFSVKIPSYKVNDGFCDCCDGSDEWLEISVLDTSKVSENHEPQYRLVKCGNECKDVLY